MIRTTRKWFWVWDYDKEEEWLNKMAAMGLAMTGVGFARYTFKEAIFVNRSIWRWFLPGLSSMFPPITVINYM